MAEIEAGAASGRSRGPGRLLQHPSPRAQHRRHEDDGGFLCRRARHGAGPRHEGPSRGRHGPRQPRQSAVRGDSALFLRHGPRRPAGLFRDPEGRQAHGRPRRDRHDAARLVRGGARGAGQRAPAPRGGRRLESGTDRGLAGCLFDLLLRPQRHPARVQLSAGRRHRRAPHCRGAAAIEVGGPEGAAGPGGDAAWLDRVTAPLDD